MNAARLHKSPRLLGTLRDLADGMEHSSMFLARNGGAVRTNIAELRANGVQITCRRVGRGHFVYRLGDGT